MNYVSSMFTSSYNNLAYDRRFRRFLLVMGIIETLVGALVFFAGYLIGKS